MGARPLLIAGLLLGAGTVDVQALGLPTDWPTESPEPIGPAQEYPPSPALQSSALADRPSEPPRPELPAPVSAAQPPPEASPPRQDDAHWVREQGSAILSPFAPRSDEPQRQEAQRPTAPPTAAATRDIDASPLNWALGLALAAAAGSVVAGRKGRLR